jgi:hypothetical protein
VGGFQFGWPAGLNRKAAKAIHHQEHDLATFISVKFLH